MVRFSRSRRARPTYRPKRRYTKRTYATRSKRTTYRRRGTTRFASRKRILNVATTKKKDTMIASRGTMLDTGRSLGITTVVPDSNGVNVPIPYLFVASGREPINAGSPGFPADTPTRTRSDVFMRMLAENIKIETGSSHPWNWRRIVFTSKDIGLVTAPGDVLVEPFWLNASGYTRYTGALFGDSTSNAIQANIINNVFTGRYLTYWSDMMTAKTDSRRVTVWHDKVISIRSGNDQGVSRVYKKVHVFNKNFLYNDAESGGVIDGEPWSTSAKPGMGNIFVLDIFKPHDAASGAEQGLTFNPTGTLYWHEK